MSQLTIDKDAIRRKYAEERAKRLRQDGNAQYQRLESKFEDLAVDPYTPFQEREPVKDHVTFAFIGAGFSGHRPGDRKSLADGTGGHPAPESDLQYLVDGHPVRDGGRVNVCGNLSHCQ